MTVTECETFPGTDHLGGTEMTLADVPRIARVMPGPLDGGITLDVPVEAAEDLTDATEALAAYNFGAAG
jgi:hypothetical protein